MVLPYTLGRRSQSFIQRGRARGSLGSAGVRNQSEGKREREVPGERPEKYLSRDENGWMPEPTQR